MPPGNLPPAILAADTTWKYIYAAPILLYVILALGFMFVVTTDGPIYCLQKQKTEECAIAVQHIYNTESPEDIKLIINKIESESSKNNDTKSVTLKEAFVSDPKYVRC